ncbi:hypothetical protein WA026_012015 [Henosepilachna vigintioctopunctata]|uniref:Uncharacterized protein n=1 Tax=Henosepilachna vigintioctopunctata TaxID=420089 RepID=A0AAW1VF82_9CUCU
MQHYLFYDPLEVKRNTQYHRHQELSYSPSTVVGNWFEERLTYKKDRFNHTASYPHHFPPKPYSRVSPDFVWTERFKSEGVNPIVHSKYGCWDYPNFFENFSTTYDLSYNHYPRWYKDIGHIERKLNSHTMQYEPEDDYIHSFHNITRRGLVEKKKEAWHLEKLNSRTTPGTHSQDIFTPPSQDDYKFTRHAPPRCNSSKLYPVNKNASYQKWRDGISPYTVVPNFDLLEVPRPPRCDPITWECPKKYMKRCPE